MGIIEITKDNCDAEIKSSPVLTVIDFWGPKCVPCLALKPKYHELAENSRYGDKVKFCEVDTSKNRRVAINFRVMQQPTFLFYKDGVELSRIGGSETTIEKITAKIEALVA